MTIEVTLTGKGLRQLAALNGQIDDAIGDGLTQAGALVSGQAGKNAFEFRYLGQLHRSYAVDVKQIGVEHTAHIGSNLVHAAVQEYGRRPGGKLPPSKPIEQWMERRGIEARLLYVIRRGIARKGTPARRHLGKALETMQGRIPGMVERAITKRLDAL